MAPPKFDDLPKVANEVLNDDYQTKGYQFKAKQKTEFQGAVVTSAVDLFPPKEASVMTPAKLTWRLPQPFGVKAVCIDKLELDKGGGLKFEASTDKAYPGLKLTCKSDVLDLTKASGGFTYTGLKDFYIAVDTKAAKPQDFTAEITWACCGPAVVGLKCSGKSPTSPDIGARIVEGPFFAALTAKEQFKTFTGVCHYKASSALRCAATCTYSGSSPSMALGASYEVNKELLLKGKVSKSSVSLGCKKTLAKGLTALSGLEYGFDGKMSYGLQLSVE